MSNELLLSLLLVRFFPLGLAGFVATRNKNYLGMLICFLYMCVTTVNYVYGSAGLNAVFSTPLGFLTAWYIIQDNRRIRLIKRR